MFIGRSEELNSLNQAYTTNVFQMAVVYGRRRVGKTFLLHEFTHDKPHTIFFTALESTAQDNLVQLSCAILNVNSPTLFPSTASPTFSSYDEALSYVFDKAEHERIVLVIDEYPYLAQSEPSISSILQKMIDQRRASSQLFLILCGSSMSFMEHQVLGEKSPLYGRRTLQLKLKPFTIFDAQQMLRTTDAVSTIEFYSLVGGMPFYLAQLDAKQTIEWNIANKILNKTSYLSIEPENYLMQETRSPAKYYAIINTIAHGSEKPVDIAHATHMSGPASIAPYLNTLQALGIVKRIAPLIKANRKQVLYHIADNLFRFWFRFVPSYASALDAGLHNAVAHHILEHDFSTFVGTSFESICRQWIMYQARAGKLPFIPANIGCWWGADPIKKEQAEIDIVATGLDGELLLGECKWHNKPVDLDVLSTLSHRATFLQSGYNHVYLFLFSKNGFSEQCIAEAKLKKNVTLVSVDRMFE